MKTDYDRFFRENPDCVRTNPSDDVPFAPLLRRLRGMPVPEAREDFAARVLDRVHRVEAEETAARRYRPLRWTVRIAAAAAVAMICAAGLRTWFGPSAAGPAVLVMAPGDAARALIVAEQGPDGAWRASVPAQDGALSAIALLALMRDDPDPLHGPRAAAVRGGMENLVALQAGPRGAGDDGTRLGRSSRYLVAMALEAGASLPGAPVGWRMAADRASLDVPPPAEAVRLNRLLAHSGSMPEPWKKAGGPVLAASLELLRPHAL